MDELRDFCSLGDYGRLLILDLNDLSKERLLIELMYMTNKLKDIVIRSNERRLCIRECIYYLEKKYKEMASPYDLNLYYRLVT